MAKHIFLGGIGTALGVFLTGALGASLDKEHRFSPTLWLLVMFLVVVICASGLIWIGDSA
jgi:hypothetical protein